MIFEAQETLLQSYHAFGDIYRESAAMLDLDSTRQEKIETCLEWIGKLRDQEFPVAFVGSYSVGKSTIVNALLGGEILPEYTGPSTPFPTAVRSGSRESVTLRYHPDATWEGYIERSIDAFERLFGSQRQDEEPLDAYLGRLSALVESEEVRLASDTLRAFYTFQEIASADPQTLPTEISLAQFRSIKQQECESLADLIELAHITIRADGLPEGIVLVDLPGLDSKHEHHTSAAEDYIVNHAKAVVVCIERSRFDGHERLLLEKLIRKHPHLKDRLFCVANKWESAGITDEQTLQNEETLGKSRKALGLDNDRVFKVSALVYLILTLIQEQRLDEHGEAQKHMKILDDEQIGLPKSKSKSRPAIEKKIESYEPARQFRLFREALFRYLASDAQKKFLDAARGDLIQTINTYLTLIPHVDADDVGDPDSLLLESSSRQKNRYLRHIHDCVEAFIKSTKENTYWNTPDLSRVKDEIRRSVDRDSIRREAFKGMDNYHGDLVLAAAQLTARVGASTQLRAYLIETAKRRFADEMSALLGALVAPELAFMPLELSESLGRILSEKDLIIRLEGLADAVLFDYGGQRAGFSSDLVSNGTPRRRSDDSAADDDERPEAAARPSREPAMLGRSARSLNHFIDKYHDNIDQLIDRYAEHFGTLASASIHNHAVYVGQAVLVELEAQEHAIRQLVYQKIKASDAISALRTRREHLRSARGTILELKQSMGTHSGSVSSDPP